MILLIVIKYHLKQVVLWIIIDSNFIPIYLEIILILDRLKTHLSITCARVKPPVKYIRDEHQITSNKKYGG